MPGPVPSWDSLAMKRPPRPSLQEMLDLAALTTAPFLGVGDVAGLAADGYRFATDPSSRTLGNAAWASLGMLPFVPAMGAMTRMARRPRGVGDRIAAILDEMGVPYEKKRSGLSGSQYFELAAPDGSPLRVRVSDHDLPLSYKQLHGEADLEFGGHGDGADYATGLRELSRILGQPLPTRTEAALKGAATRSEKEIARIRDAAAEFEAARLQRAEITRSALNDPDIRQLAVSAKNASAAELDARLKALTDAVEARHGVRPFYSRGSLRDLLKTPQD